MSSTDRLHVMTLLHFDVAVSLLGTRTGAFHFTELTICENLSSHRTPLRNTSPRISRPGERIGACYLPAEREGAWEMCSLARGAWRDFCKRSIATAVPRVTLLPFQYLVQILLYVLGVFFST